MGVPDKTSEKYIREYSILERAGISVVMTPTSDVFRAKNALLKYAATKGYEMKTWTHIDGWEDMKKNELEAPQKDGQIDPFKALMKLDQPGAERWPKSSKNGGIYVMVYPHFWLSKSPGMIQGLKNFANEFPLSSPSRRVVLLVPEGTSIPQELQKDVTLLDYGLPNKPELKNIFDSLVTARFEDAKVKYPFTEAETEAIVNMLSGMSELEAENALQRALITFRPQKDEGTKFFSLIKFKPFMDVVTKVKMEAIKNTEVLSLLDDASMKDVGGFHVFKEYMDTVAVSLSPKGKKAGLDRPKGVLAVGPPGTGKSLIAKALGNALNQRVIRFDMSAVFHKHVGESEARIRSAIKVLKAMAPVVVLVDEVDKQGFAGGGGGGDSGTTSRVLGTLLWEMQEAEEELFWIFTANWPDKIDPALLRKGRMDEIFAVLEPNNEERLEVLKIHLRKRGHTGLISEDLSTVIEATKGFVSAEIEAIVKDAWREAFAKDEPLTVSRLLKQAQSTRPISQSFKEQFDYMHDWAAKNAKNASHLDKVIDVEVENLQPVATPEPRKRKL